MSPISSTSSSSTTSAAAYQEYLARLQAQKQSAKITGGANTPKPQAPAPVGDVDHDGDSR